MQITLALASAIPFSVRALDDAGADLLARPLHKMIKLKPTCERNVLQSWESGLFQFGEAFERHLQVISVIERWEKRQLF